MTDIHYYDYIMVLGDGKQIPWIKIHNDDSYRLIEKIGTSKFRDLSNLENLLEKLKSVEDEKKEYVYHGNLELLISTDSTFILEDTTDALNCTVATSKLIEIIEGWYNFLKSYEDGEIPGIIHPDKRDHV